MYILKRWPPCKQAWARAKWKTSPIRFNAKVWRAMNAARSIKRQSWQESRHPDTYRPTALAHTAWRKFTTLMPRKQNRRRNLAFRQNQKDPRVKRTTKPSAITSSVSSTNAQKARLSLKIAWLVTEWLNASTENKCSSNPQSPLWTVFQKTIDRLVADIFFIRKIWTERATRKVKRFPFFLPKTLAAKSHARWLPYFSSFQTRTTQIWCA